MKIGKELGLSGDELKQFAKESLREQRDFEREQLQVKKEREAEEREERQLMREERRKEEEERELIKKAEWEERHKREEEQERIRRIELEDKERERRHETEMIAKKNRQELELAKVKQEGAPRNVEVVQQNVHRFARVPKLPFFNSAVDDIDAYLQRFELYATAQGWAGNDWATNLSALLTGQALNVYTRRPADVVTDYQGLKRDLLHQFRLTVEGYRNKFLLMRFEKGESASQYVARLTNAFDRYVKLSEIETTYEKLRDLMIKDQFISSCEPELALFLKERAPGKINEAAILADRFLDARMYGKTSGKFQNVNSNFQADGKAKFAQSVNRFGSSGSGMRVKLGDRVDADVKTPQEQNVYTRIDKRCFFCNQSGHLARN